MNMAQRGSREEAVQMMVPCEVYSRIVGYLRPIRNWNRAKRHEFRARRTFRIPGEEDA